MDVRITPHPLAGSVVPPPSKSMAHRLLLASLLAGGPAALPGSESAQDLRATAACAAALRAGPAGELPLLECGESGSTLRFLIPVALALRGGGRFSGRGRLMERPQTPYRDLFAEKGIFYHLENGVLTVRGALRAGTYRLPGDVSSQFVTGLLFALPLLDGDSEILLTTPLESRSYVDMTLGVLARSGVAVENEGYRRLRVPGGQKFRPLEAAVPEADWSQAAFWYAASFLGQPLQIENLDPDSAQGDRVVSRLYWTLARPGDVEIDVSDCPDLVPPLAVMAAARRGRARLTGAGRLRLKESDRLKTTAALINALGGRAAEGPDSLCIRGVSGLAGGTVDGAGDHRVVMAAAVAAAYCRGPTLILGAEAVLKSYPSFFGEFQRLGGIVHVV